MLSFSYKKGDEFVGLLHRPETGNYISKAELEKLKPCIERILNTTLSLKNDGFAMDEDFSSLIDVSERVIVPQSMGNGPSIRHRPLYFEDCNDMIKVKYTQFGDFNNFDKVIETLSK